MALPYVRRGDTGAKVRRVQGLCIAWGGDARKAVESTGGVDGRAGAGFDRAVRAVQRAAGITVDGIVYRQTYTKLLRG